MRILMLAQFYPPVIGGEERHVRNLSIDLVRRGHEVTVVTTGQPGGQAAQFEDGVKIYRLRGTVQRTSVLFWSSEHRQVPPFPDPELLLGLHQIVRREKPDVVHAHNWMVHSYLPLKRLYGAPLILTLHDFSLVCAKKSALRQGALCSGPAVSKCLVCATQHYGVFKGSITAIGNWASCALEKKRVDAFIAVSKAVAEGNHLAKLGVPFAVIPNFVPDNIAALGPDGNGAAASLPDTGYILFVGDLSQNKGISVLLEAYAALQNAPPLVLIGRRCATTPAALPPGVSMYHDWPHNAILHAWSRCLFGILPSICPDACPTVIMEAMASGKAVVATDIGGSPDLVDHGYTGLLAVPGSAQSLASAMRELIGDPGLRQNMGSAALTKVEAHKAKAVVSRIEHLYKQLLSPCAKSVFEEAQNAA